MKASLQKKMNRFLVLFVAIPLLVMALVVCYIGLKTLIRQEGHKIALILDNIEADALLVTSQTESIVRILADDDSISQLLRSESDAEWATIYKSCVLNEITRAEAYLSSVNPNIMLLGDNVPLESWYYLLNSNRFEGETGYDTFMESGAKSSWCGMMKTMPTSLAEVNDYRYLGKKLIYYYRIRTGGYIRCAINPGTILNAANRRIDGRQFFFLSADEVFYSNAEMTDMSYLNGLPLDTSLISRGMIWRRHKLANLNVSVVISTPLKQLFFDFLTSFSGLLVLIFMSVVLMFIISGLVMKQILMRLERVAVAADNIQLTEKRVQLPEEADDEVGRVVKAFNRLFNRIDVQTEQTVRKEKDKRHMQALALQYQLNPHFLFNSLMWMQMELEEREVDLALSARVTDLAKVLRYNLSEPLKATVYEETEHLRLYVSFMSGMKCNEIELDSDIDDSLLLVSIPRFILQPVVENALQHGLIYGKSMWIHLSAQSKGDMLIFCISNNGKRISEEGLDELNQIFNNPTTRRSGGFGLSNLVQRMKLYYNDRYRISVSSDDESTVFVIEIPFSLEKESADEVFGCR